MTFTYVNARYNTPDNSVVIAETDEAGLVLVSRDDHPEEWASLLAARTPEPYAPPIIASPRSVAMWRARTIMKVTPWGEGTLFQVVQEAIAGLADPLQKAAAEEALERGSDFDRDGVFVPMLAAAVGISDEQLDELMARAAALPA